MLREDCEAELPPVEVFTVPALLHFLPIGGVKVTLRCHGNDSFLDDATKTITIYEQRIHTIISDKGGWRLTFPLPAQPSTGEPAVADAGAIEE